MNRNPSLPVQGRRRQAAGFTLIELMVSVAIGLFLIAGVGSVYVASRRVFSSTGATTGMDDNARTAFEWIGASARQAGYQGCNRLSGTVNGDVRGSVNTANWWQNFANPVQGYTIGSGDPGFNNGSGGSAINATDALVLIGADTTGQAMVQNDDETDNPAVITTTTAHGFQAGQILLATDCQTNSYFVASTAAGTTITHAAGANCSQNLSSSCSGVTSAPAAGTNVTIAPGGLILPIVATAYFIAPSATGTTKGNSLWALTSTTSGTPTAVELVNGVQNMKIDYGIDTNDDGSIDGYTDTVTNWSQVAAIQVHLLLATLPDSGAVSSGSNTYTFDGSTVNPKAADPTDNRIYREYTSVFSLRNKSY